MITAELVDISEVSVNRDLTKVQRISEYIRHSNDPYRGKCGEYTVTARFSPNGPPLEDCLQRLMAL